jgi:hypothetical protein
MHVLFSRVDRASLTSRILIALLVLGAIGLAFAGGLWFGRTQLASVSKHALALTEERDAFGRELAGFKQRNILLERNRQVDRAANRAALEALEKAQDRRLALEKELSLFRRLVHAGGGGILQVKDFRLVPTGDARVFRYSFTVSQLMQEFGESSGSVELRVVGKRNGKHVTLPLAELKGSAPTIHRMKFRSFQSLAGTIKLSQGLDPESLIVQVLPNESRLIPATETFAWNPRD